MYSFNEFSDDEMRAIMTKTLMTSTARYATTAIT